MWMPDYDHTMDMQNKLLIWCVCVCVCFRVLLEKQGSGDGVSAQVCMVKQSVKKREERITEQNGFFHCCASHRTEHRRILSLKNKQKHWINKKIKIIENKLGNIEDKLGTLWSLLDLWFFGVVISGEGIESS